MTLFNLFYLSIFIIQIKAYPTVQGITDLVQDVRFKKNDL